MTHRTADRACQGNLKNRARRPAQTATAGPRILGRMRALRFSRHGGPEVLSVAEVPVPDPGPGEVLVRVRAAGVNPVDAGLLAFPLPFVSDLRFPATPGWDMAGTVTATGPGTAGFGPGDAVFGLSRFPRLGPGTFAEYTVVPAADLAGKPAELPW